MSFMRRPTTMKPRERAERKREDLRTEKTFQAIPYWAGRLYFCARGKRGERGREQDFNIEKKEKKRKLL